MALFDAMLREAVVVRPVAGYGFPSAQRITVGTPAENRRVLAALRKVLGR
jgi:histidinol-phosphate aminotransferase